MVVSLPTFERLSTLSRDSSVTAPEHALAVRVCGVGTYASFAAGPTPMLVVCVGFGVSAELAVIVTMATVLPRYENVAVFAPAAMEIEFDAVPQPMPE